jgi:MFS family permease
MAISMEYDQLHVAKSTFLTYSKVIGSVNTILKKLYKQEYKHSSAQSNITSLVFAGEVVGIIIFGYTSDRFSRKWSIFASTVILVCVQERSHNENSLTFASSSSLLWLPARTVPMVASMACYLHSLPIVSFSVLVSAASILLVLSAALKAPASWSLGLATDGSSGSLIWQSMPVLLSLHSFPWL